VKLKIIYTIESIFDLPGKQNYQERIFICEVASMYEWRYLLSLTVNPTYDQEIFVKQITQLS
jgi:hypothetical protein